MGISQRNHSEIPDKMTRMQRAHEDHADAVATVQQFNARLSAKGRVWAWPTIAAALTSKHHWLVIACDSCGTVTDLDLRVKPRDPDASIRVALGDVCCPRCNGHGAGAVFVDLGNTDEFVMFALPAKANICWCN